MLVPAEEEEVGSSADHDGDGEAVLGPRDAEEPHGDGQQDEKAGDQEEDAGGT